MAETGIASGSGGAGIIASPGGTSFGSIFADVFRQATRVAAPSQTNIFSPRNEKEAGLGAGAPVWVIDTDELDLNKVNFGQTVNVPEGGKTGSIIMILVLGLLGYVFLKGKAL